MILNSESNLFDDLATSLPDRVIAPEYAEVPLNHLSLFIYLFFLEPEYCYFAHGKLRPKATSINFHHVWTESDTHTYGGCNREEYVPLGANTGSAPGYPGVDPPLAPGHPGAGAPHGLPGIGFPGPTGSFNPGVPVPPGAIVSLSEGPLPEIPTPETGDEPNRDILARLLTGAQGMRLISPPPCHKGRTPKQCSSELDSQILYLPR
jgi:hypothetical protein